MNAQLMSDIFPGRPQKMAAGPSQGRGTQRVTQTTTTTTTTTRTTTRTTTTGGAKAVRRKLKPRKTRRRKPRTYIVEYDIDEYNNKFASSRRVIKRRARRTRRKVSRKCGSHRRAGQSGAEAGGAVDGVPGGQGLRPAYPKLHLFGNTNALEYFSDDSDAGDGIASLNNSIEAGDGLMVRAAIRSITNRQRLRCKNVGSIPATAGSVDILSNIMDTMSEWHSVSRPSTIEKIKINADGSLEFEKKAAEKASADKRPSADPNAHILNAPLYPRNGVAAEGANPGVGAANSFQGNNGTPAAGDASRIGDSSRGSEQFQSGRTGATSNTPNRGNFVSESFSFRNQNRNQRQRPGLSRNQPEAAQSLYDGEEDLPIRSEAVGERK